jgi:hypothetical protein
LLPFLVRLACVRHAASVDSEPGSNSRLKPDAYRRVEGRLPSPHIQGSLQKPLWFQQCEMAPPFSFSFPRGIEKTMVVYLVRSLGLMPESVSHDWHVQPSCQRPNRDPPERCEFSPGELARVRIRLSSKPYKHTCGEKSCQSTHPTGFPDDFHSLESPFWEAETGELPAKSRFLTGLSARFGMTNLWAMTNLWVWRSRIRATVWPSDRNHYATFGAHFRQPDTEDKKLRKDPFGGPCFEGTLRKPCCFSE